MSGVLHGVIASLKTAVASVTDAYFKYVSLLLNTTSTNGAQNNTFLDSSTNAFSVTRNGDTTQGSFNPYMPTGYWSGYFDGTGDDLRLSTNAAFALGAGDFTFEAWINPSNWTNAVVPFFVVSGTGGFWVGKNSSNFVVRAFNVADQLTYGTLPTVGAWTHIVAVRSGTTLSMYYNGTRVATTTNSYNFAQAKLGIGSDADTVPLYYTGYISNARLVKGTAVYDPTQTTLTVPTTPLTAITNTSLLCLQDNRFIDNSTNAFAITRNGDTRISKFAPFNPPASYSTATYGGSGYFDGTGDYLGIADSAALDLNSTYTLEFWFYQPAAGSGVFFGRGGGASSWSNTNGMEYVIFILSGTFYYQFNNGSGTIPAQITTAAPAAGQWHHVAVGYNGTTTRVWIDGSSIGTSPSAYNLPTTRNITRVGLSPDTTIPLTGYVSNLRVVKGTDVYGVGNTSIAVPTTPLTAITNTSLLLNFDNAGIYDATTINDAETEGNAQVSTTQAKFGTTSMYFDGTGDYLATVNKPEIRFGTSPFTVEMWVYCANAASGATQDFVGTLTNAAGDTNWHFSISSTGVLQAGTYNTLLANSGATTLSSTTWTHVAFTFDGTTYRVFVNGTVGSTTSTAVKNLSDSTNPLRVGATNFGGRLFTGYIDDLRITNGYARYTGNFTPPTAAFPTR